MRRRLLLPRSIVGVIATALLSVIAVEDDAHAADDAPPRSNVHDLAYNTRADITITSTGAVWWIASELMKPELVPEKCRWCYRRPDGASDLNVLDGNVRLALKWKNEKAADRASSVLAFFLMPATQLGLLTGAAAHDGAAISNSPLDALLAVEATMLAVDLNQLVKFAFARERPFVHYLPRAADGVRKLTDSPSDDNLSFYSGHTNLAFAIAGSSSAVALLRGYRLAPLVVGAGFLSAAAVGYLRIGADKHYLSDVMVGAVVGTAVGFAIPLLFHPREEDRDAATTTTTGTIGSAGSAFTTQLLSGAW